MTIPAGSCPSVGVSGVTLGGGMGLAARAFGMSCDNLMGAHVVTADGKLHHVNKQSDPNFLWALRGGGGGNFGVVTQFTFKVHKIPRQTSYFFVSWPSSRAADAIAAWQSWAPHARDQLTSIFHIDPGASVSVSGQYMGPASDLNKLLAPLRNSGGTVSVRQPVVLQPADDVRRLLQQVLVHAVPHGQRLPRRRDATHGVPRQV